MTDGEVGELIAELNRNYETIDGDRMMPVDYDAAVARDRDLMRRLIASRPETWQGVTLKAAFLRPLVDQGAGPEFALTHSVLDDIIRFSAMSYSD